MATTAYKLPRTASNYAYGTTGIDDEWVNLNDIKTRESNPDGVDTFCWLGKGSISDYLVASNFNLNVPANATINGVEVRIKKIADSKVKDHEVYLRNGSLSSKGAIGSNRAKTTSLWKAAGSSWVYENTIYGGSKDRFGASLTPAIVNNSNFGVFLRAASARTSELGDYAYVDSIEIRVHYTLPTPIPTAQLESDVYGKNLLPAEISTPLKVTPDICFRYDIDPNTLIRSNITYDAAEKAYKIVDPDIMFYEPSSILFFHQGLNQYAGSNTGYKTSFRRTAPGEKKILKFSLKLTEGYLFQPGIAWFKSDGTWISTTQGEPLVGHDAYLDGKVTGTAPANAHYYCIKINFPISITDATVYLRKLQVSNMDVPYRASRIHITDYKLPTTVVNGGGDGLDWTNLDGAKQIGGDYARVTCSAGAYPKYLNCQNFGFNIPAGMQIIGVMISSLEWNSNGNYKQNRVILMRGAGGGNWANIANINKSLPTTTTPTVYGGFTFLPESLSREQINIGAFGVAINHKNNHASASQTLGIDAVEIRLVYGEIIEDYEIIIEEGETELSDKPNLLLETGKSNHRNVARAGNELNNLNGFLNLGGVIPSLASDWAVDVGGKSVKFSFPGVSTGEAGYISYGDLYYMPVSVGDERTLLIYYKSAAPFKLAIMGRDEGSVSREESNVNIPAAPSGGIAYVSITFTRSDITKCSFKVMGSTTPVANEVYIGGVVFCEGLVPCHPQIPLEISQAPLSIGYDVVTVYLPDLGCLIVYESGYIGIVSLDRGHSFTDVGLKNEVFMENASGARNFSKSRLVEEIKQLKIRVLNKDINALSGLAAAPGIIPINTNISSHDNDPYNHRGYVLFSNPNFKRVNQLRSDMTADVTYITKDLRTLLSVDYFIRDTILEGYDAVLDYQEAILYLGSANLGDINSVTTQFVQGSPEPVFSEEVLDIAVDGGDFQSYISNDVITTPCRAAAELGLNGAADVQARLCLMDSSSAYTGQSIAFEACILKNRIDMYQNGLSAGGLAISGWDGYNAEIEIDVDDINTVVLTAVLTNADGSTQTLVSPAISLTLSSFKGIFAAMGANGNHVILKEFTLTKNVFMEELDNTLRNVVHTPLPLTVNIEHTFTRNTSDGLLYCYNNPTGPILFKIDPLRFYEGAVKLFDEVGEQILNPSKIFSSDDYYTLENGIVRLIFNEREETVDVYGFFFEWMYLCTLTVDGVFHLTLQSISRDSVTLNVGGTKWTLKTGKPFFNVEHPDNDILVIDVATTFNKFWAENGEGIGVTADLLSASQEISPNNLFYYLLSNTANNIGLQVLQSVRSMTSAEIIPASDMTGLGWYNKEAVAHEHHGSLGLEWLAKSGQDIKVYLD